MSQGLRRTRCKGDGKGFHYSSIIGAEIEFAYCTPRRQKEPMTVVESVLRALCRGHTATKPDKPSVGGSPGLPQPDPVGYDCTSHNI